MLERDELGGLDGGTLGEKLGNFEGETLGNSESEGLKILGFVETDGFGDGSLEKLGVLLGDSEGCLEVDGNGVGLKLRGESLGVDLVSTLITKILRDVLLQSDAVPSTATRYSLLPSASSGKLESGVVLNVIIPNEST